MCNCSYMFISNTECSHLTVLYHLFCSIPNPPLTYSDFQYNGDINYLEHVEVQFSVVGDEMKLHGVHLLSPQGTSSNILPAPFSAQVYHLESVQFWGENPQGVWYIDFFSEEGEELESITVEDIKFHGIGGNVPAHLLATRRCSPECDPNRGCFKEGSNYCDACAPGLLRSGQACVQSCPESDNILQRRYCVDTQYNPVCNAEKPTVG